MSDRIADEWDEEEEKSDPYSHIDKDEQAALRAEGAAQFGQIIRRSIGDRATHALESQVAEGADDVLLATPKDQWTYEQHSEAYGRGLEDMAEMPTEVRERMERGMR